MTNDRRLQKILGAILAGCAAVMLLLYPLTAAAEVEYITYTKDNEGTILRTHPAYAPVRVIGTGLMEPEKDNPQVLKPSPMASPKDLFIDSRDHIYVVDTGNNRLIEFDDQGNWLRYLKVPESPLNKPEGIFVTPQGDIYVADTGNKRVVKLTPEGKLVRAYEKPESNYIPDAFKYDPIRLVVDKRGFLYIATLGGYQGLLQLDPEGEFQRFYGVNTTELTPLDRIKRMLYTDQMYANEISKLPGSISSVAIDRDGFIYTATAGKVTSNQVKKLSIRGQNMLKYNNNNGEKKSREFGEIPPSGRIFISGQGYLPTQLIDLAVDLDGNITTIDSSYKVISRYDASGNLLYYWGGISSNSTTRLGLVKNPAAVDSNSKGDLLILDNTEGNIQWFRQSEFGSLVSKANMLTIEGRYEESEELWQEVLRYHAFFTPAHLGLAKAAFKKGDYKLAQAYFYEGGSRSGYSDAYWQIRLKWFQSHFSTLITAVLAFVFGVVLFNRLTRRSKWRQSWRNRKRNPFPIFEQLRHTFTILKHPIDGFSALRHEGKGSYGSALVLLAITFAALVFSRLQTSFTFNPVNPDRFNVLILLGEFAVLWLGWVICNYLVSSILQGEGRFRDVFIASSYALFPFIIIGIPLALISNIMTLSELSIFNYMKNAILIWLGFLFIWKIQSLQNYTVGETLRNVVYTTFAFSVLIVLCGIIFGLSSDLKSFLFEIYQEVRLR
ncbi:YIP1 family protein [Paenibacillus koleovorans]|uniref:YIP1 family protein n=1 Tax=Paenibacillus koleovorans TaxID=121608 RepID=UPI000FD9F656|nr:YIP1 family protein [Paenibacillus koleovorans]